MLGELKTAAFAPLKDNTIRVIIIGEGPKQRLVLECPLFPGFEDLFKEDAIKIPWRQ